jgi:predicted DNA-binding transcriptional regulator YafY
MGIPIAAERGPAGSYSLKRGSRLPPLIFNDSEASAIMLGLTAMRQMNFPLDVVAIEGALAKTERLLPERLFRYVNDMRDLIKIHSPSYSSTARIDHRDFVRLLGQAIQKRQRALLTYSSHTGVKTVREVDVYGLVLVADQWYAPGYCHLREGLRVFRVDRLLSIVITETGFEGPKNFDLLKYVLDSIEQVQTTFEVEVVLETTLEKAQGFFASEAHFLTSIEGGVLYGLTTSRLDWIAFALLTINVPFTIRKPTELYGVFQVIAQRAARIGKASVDGV